MNYYVIAVRYPRRFNPLTKLWTPSGVEFIGDPDHNENDAIAIVREKLGKGLKIEFAHHITMNDCPRDVKAELISAAEQAILEEV